MVFFSRNALNGPLRLKLFTCNADVKLKYNNKFHYGPCKQFNMTCQINSSQYINCAKHRYFSTFPSNIAKMGFTSTFKSTSEKAEGLFNVATAPIKPYLPSISRFMIVATFYEDALRIMWQWKDHILYLEAARGFPKYLAPVFLGFNSIVSTFFFPNCERCSLW